MRILLVHPPNTDVYGKIDKKGSKTPPIGLMYLAAVLEREKYQVGILDAEANNMDVSATVKEALGRNPDLVGITATTPLIIKANEIAERIKKERPDTVTVLGGPHSSALPIDSVSPDYIDYVVYGEGEYSFLELIRCLEARGNVESLRGIVHKTKGKATLTPPMPFIDDLDALPFPARHLAPPQLYTHTRWGNKTPYAIMVSSRGCPYNCSFCGSCITFGHKVRLRSPVNVVDEIESVIKKFDIHQITFSDDTFTLNAERTVKICKGIIDRKLDISFICSSRVNTIDDERLKWLEKAGCDTVTFGIESGDDRVLRSIGKGITVAAARKAIKLVRKYKIKVHASYMIGNPGETPETIEKTLSFAKELATDDAQFSIATPYPGTKFWEDAKAAGKLKTDDFSKYGWYYNVVYVPDGLTSQQLIDYQKRAYEDFNKIAKH